MHTCFLVTEEVKKDHLLVKDDSSIGRPSTSRIKAKVKQLRHMVCGGRWLTTSMITSQLYIKKDSVWMIITEDLDMSEK